MSDRRRPKIDSSTFAAAGFEMAPRSPHLPNLPECQTTRPIGSGATVENRDFLQRHDSKMEAVGAAFGIVDVALRASSKAWKLSGVWRDAPAEVHRLRDELDRAERFFIETQQGIESLYAVARHSQPESHATWAEIERLLASGAAVLHRIEAVIDNLTRPNASNPLPSQPLSKTRRIIWVTSSRKTAAAREELRATVSDICNLLIAQNM